MDNVSLEQIVRPIPVAERNEGVRQSNGWTGYQPTVGVSIRGSRDRGIAMRLVRSIRPTVILPNFVMILDMRQLSLLRDADIPVYPFVPEGAEPADDEPLDVQSLIDELERTKEAWERREELSIVRAKRLRSKATQNSQELSRARLPVHTSPPDRNDCGDDHLMAAEQTALAFRRARMALDLR